MRASVRVNAAKIILMKRRFIGSSTLEVSPLALGCWAFAGGENWGDQDENESISVIRSALDRGIDLFDTAPGYGNGESERILGLALKGRRDEAVIATKVSETVLAKADLIASCERSLSLLQTDRIDLLQVHWASRSTPFEESIAALEQLKDAGKIRYYGVCNFGLGDMKEWLGKGGEMISNQLPYSLLTRSIEYEIVPECITHEVSILPYSPLMQGLLTGKFVTAASVPDGRARSRHFNSARSMARHGEPGCEGETFAAVAEVKRIAEESDISMAELSLAWALKQPSVASLIVGARSIKQLEENARCLNTVVDDEIDQELKAATEAVKRHLGTNADLWSDTSRYR